MPKQQVLRKTLIHDQVGSVRASAIKLPEGSHEFGKEIAKDPENAGQVLEKWVVGVPSKSKESQRSFVKTNLNALKAGCVSAKDQRRYAVEHPNIRKKQVKGTRKESDAIPHTGPFGRPNEVKEFTVNEIMEAKFTSFDSEDKVYPDLSGLQTKGRLPLPRHTKASMGQATRGRIPEPEKALFKMKKFQNVAGKLDHSR
mmetsp:Transcript_48235/g.65671  ORF Transcript_48235/g.65671 Transcript_48235/m.65671 type:complete len:199 (-) Transcript_48235:272-868(-)|eukprot:CAMPEP_0185774526 /NCGR_PEP_ID=MMETSP1174-20130828/78658_1 /TAXON_ID=35687 /ORGANISM="Dictyocha speculum, Strain CCMP1381" /LENGTH=198 /DNA_ID=CAMNT_0028461741 /DNA_START=71 /DNA_END=667 /DNA_ORIENTATION=+